MVKVGFTDEARTMSRLSPVARMDSPSRVPRNRYSSTPARMVTAADRISSCHCSQKEARGVPASRPLARVNRVSFFIRLALDFQPMAIRLTVYSPVLVTMPARMDGTPMRVWRKAVTNPAQAPAAMAAGMARTGWPAAVTVTDTAAPRTKQPSVVRSAMSRMR